MGGWSARINNAYQWLQIDLRRPHKVVRVSTQGRSAVNQWVTSYYLRYSQYGVYFTYYFERNTRKVGFSVVSAHIHPSMLFTDICALKWITVVV